MAVENNVSVIVAAGLETTWGTAAASGGGKKIRRVTSSIIPMKDTFASEEVRGDQQVYDMRHGMERAGGSLDCEMSLTSHDDFYVATMRADWVAGVAKSNTQFTSAAADSGTSKFTFAGGDSITEGLKIGDVIRFTNLSEALNNNVNYLITNIAGANNRELTVYPAPTTMAADITFNVVVVGNKLTLGTTDKSLTIEHNYPTLDVSEQFLGMRVNGMRVNAPPNAMATVSFDLIGKQGAYLSGGSAPYFSAPTAEPTTNVLTLAGVSGLVYLNSAVSAVVTGLELSFANNLDMTPVAGSNTAPAIFYGRRVITGSVSAYMESAALANLFINETEFNLHARFNEPEAAPIDFLAFHMNRLKVTGIQKTLTGTGGVIINLQFQALLKSGGAATAYDQTTLTIQRSTA